MFAKELNIESSFSAIDFIHYYARLEFLEKEQESFWESLMIHFQSDSSDSLIGESFFKVFGVNFSIDPGDYESDYEIIHHHAVRLFELNEVEIDFSVIDSLNFKAGIYLNLRIDGISYKIIRISLDGFGRIKGIHRGQGIEDFLLQMMFSQLRENFIGIERLAEEFDMNLNPSNSDMMMRYHQFVDLKREERTRANSVVPIKTFERELIEDSDHALGVFQNHYAIKKYDETSDINALKTFGADNCVILIVYDVKNQVGYMNHLTGWEDDVETKRFLYRMIALFNQAGGELLRKSQISTSTNEDLLNDSEIEITLIGGNSRFFSRLYIYNMRTFLENNLYFSSFNQDILTGKSEDAWLDLKNGKISTFDLNRSLQSNEFPPLFGHLPLSSGVRKTEGSL